MKKEFNILFPAPGRRVTLIKYFKKALRDLGFKSKLVGTDITLTAPAMHILDKRYIGPKLSNPSYISDILDVCKKENIDLIIPLIDPELRPFSINKGKFEDIGVTVLISDSHSIDITQNKFKTYEFLKENSIKTPSIINIDKNTDKSILPYPLFLKPASGNSSKGAHKINNMRELDFYSDQIKDPLCQEYIEGEEYTVSTFVDLKGQIKAIVPRKRIEVRNGEISKGMTLKDNRIMVPVKDTINLIKGLLGPVVVQGILDKKGEFQIIEINPRFGGGDVLTIKAGCDFPRWIIEMLNGKEIKCNINDWEDKLVMLRHDQPIFIKGKDLMPI